MLIAKLKFCSSITLEQLNYELSSVYNKSLSSHDSELEMQEAEQIAYFWKHSIDVDRDKQDIIQIVLG